MTFRDHCILKAALTLFAGEHNLPPHIAEIASNDGQFAVTAADAEGVAQRFEKAVFADRLIGDLTVSDAQAIAELVASSVPEQRKDRASKGRQQRFLERVQTFNRS